MTGVSPSVGGDAPDSVASPHLVGQFHGILTGKSSPTWPTFGSGWFGCHHPGVVTVNSEYFALPLPRVEMLRNRRRSRDLARAIMVEYGIQGPRTPVSLVSHSNGAVLALRVARDLIARGVPLRSLVLIAPAIRTAEASREIGRWLDRGMLDYALLVRPTRDRLIGAIGSSWRTKLYAWPWGSLGADGWDIDETGFVFPNPPETLDLPDMGHSDPVAPANREWLYASVIAPALGLAPWMESTPRGGVES